MWWLVNGLYNKLLENGKFEKAVFCSKILFALSKLFIAYLPTENLDNLSSAKPMSIKTDVEKTFEKYGEHIKVLNDKIIEIENKYSSVENETGATVVKSNPAKAAINKLHGEIGKTLDQINDYLNKISKVNLTNQIIQMLILIILINILPTLQDWRPISCRMIKNRMHCCNAD